MAQLIRLSTFRRKNTIELLTAGEEQIAICNPIVYLEATVGGSIDGHTFEWVQIDGTPTVTLEPVLNEPLKAYYTVPGLPGSDKTFRFYIDRNTQFQKYKDFIVRTTPTDYLRPYASGVNGLDLPMDSDLLADNMRTVADVPFDYNISFNSYGTAVNGSVVLAFDPPAYEDSLAPLEVNAKGVYISTDLESLVNGVWIVLDTFPSGALTEYTLNTAGRLRFTSTYKNHLGLYSVSSAWFDIDPSTIVAVVGKNVLSQISSGVNDINIVVDKIIYSLTLVTYTDTIAQLASGVNALNTNITKIVYTLMPLDITDTINAFSSGISNLTFTATRVSGSNIGG